MKKFLLILLLIIIVPIVGLLLFLKFADFNNYKPQIEQLALKYANLIVKINGDLKIATSLKPNIELNDVTITQAENNKQIAKIGSALVQFSVMPLLKKEIVVDKINTGDTEIFYGEQDSVFINHFAAGMDGFDGQIDFSFNTDVSGLNITGTGKTSSFKSIQNSQFNDVNTQAEVKALGYVVNFDGDIKGLQNGLTVNGKYDVIYKSNLISGNIYADLTSITPYLKLNANSDKINVIDFTSSQQAFYAGFVSNAHASELIPNTQIPYQYFSMANADVSLNINELIINNDMTLTDILSDITLKNSVFKADIKNINAGGGKVSGVMNVNANTKNVGVNLNGKDIVLQNLYTPLTDKSNSEYINGGGKSNLLINLTTSGNDTNQYLSNLNGQVIALVDSSVVRIKSLEKLQGNIIAQILSNLKINITGSDMNLKCAVVRGDISNGVINFPKGIVFDANDFYVVANGTTNLFNDKIDFALQPFSGKIKDTNVSSVLGSLLKVKGTILQPKLAINQTETAKAVVGALASGGTYNLGDMFLSADSSPCFTALKGTAYATYFKGEEKGLQRDISQTYQDAKKAVKDLGEQAKGLLKGLMKK